MAAKKRLDVELVGRGLVESRERAQALILAGEVYVDQQKARKAGQPVGPGVHLEVRQPLRYVTRSRP